MNLAPFSFIYDTFMTQSTTFTVNDTNKRKMNYCNFVIYSICFLH